MLSDFTAITSQILVLCVTAVGVGAAVYTLSFSRRQLRRAADEANAINDKRQETTPTSSTQSGDLLPPEERQYLLLKEYHAQGLSQSKMSFWFSLIFASIGFLVIIVGLLSVQSDKELSKQTVSFVSLLSGTVIDAVSALFFVQSNKARQLMAEFFDKLRADRKLDESLRLAGSISDPGIKNRVQAVMALSFSVVKASDSILNGLLGLDKAHQAREVRKHDDEMSKQTDDKGSRTTATEDNKTLFPVVKGDDSRSNIGG